MPVSGIHHEDIGRARKGSQRSTVQGTSGEQLQQYRSAGLRVLRNIIAQHCQDGSCFRRSGQIVGDDIRGQKGLLGLRLHKSRYRTCANRASVEM
jgi:hypothetical protein